MRDMFNTFPCHEVHMWSEKAACLTLKTSTTVFFIRVEVELRFAGHAVNGKLCSNLTRDSKCLQLPVK